MPPTVLEMSKTVLKTYLFKACPRCHGDLILDLDAGQERDSQVVYVCLQCGRPREVLSDSQSRLAAVFRAA